MTDMTDMTDWDNVSVKVKERPNVQHRRSDKVRVCIVTHLKGSNRGWELHKVCDEIYDFLCDETKIMQ